MPQHALSRVVILGGSGFVGSALRREFASCPAMTVLAYSSGDLDLTRKGAANALAGVLDGATALIVAARAHRRPDPLDALHDEVAMATTIARAITQSPPWVCVYLSTLAVYGEASTNLAITEDTPIAPTAHYGLGKYVGESLIRLTADRTGVPLIVLRPCNIYGHGDPDAYSPTTFIRSILEEGRVRLFGDGEELRDHIYVQDVAEVVTRLTLEGRVGTYNLASGESHSFREIVGILREVCTEAFDVEHAERTMFRVDLGVDVTRLRHALPDLHLTPLRQGLEETYASLAVHSQ